MKNHKHKNCKQLKNNYFYKPILHSTSKLTYSNDSIISKREEIRKKTIYLSHIWKNTQYKFRKFYQKIIQLHPCYCQKAIEYESIGYLSYQKKLII